MQLVLSLLAFVVLSGSNVGVRAEERLATLPDFSVCGHDSRWSFKCGKIVYTCGFGDDELSGLCESQPSKGDILVLEHGSDDCYAMIQGVIDDPWATTEIACPTASISDYVCYNDPVKVNTGVEGGEINTDCNVVADPVADPVSDPAAAETTTTATAAPETMHKEEDPAAVESSSCGCSPGDATSWKCGTKLFYCGETTSLCSNSAESVATENMFLLSEDQCTFMKTLHVGDDCPKVGDEPASAISHMVCYGTSEFGTKTDGNECEQCTGVVPVPETMPPQIEVDPTPPPEPVVDPTPPPEPLVSDPLPIETLSPTEAPVVDAPKIVNEPDPVLLPEEDSPTEAPLVDTPLIVNKPDPVLLPEEATPAPEADCSCGPGNSAGSWKCGTTVYYCPTVQSICSNQGAMTSDYIELGEADCLAYQQLSVGDACPELTDTATAVPMDGPMNSLSNVVCYDVLADGSFSAGMMQSSDACEVCTSSVDPPVVTEPPKVLETDPPLVVDPTAEPTPVVDPTPPPEDPTEPTKVVDPTEPPLVVVDPTPPPVDPTDPPADPTAEPTPVVDPTPPPEDPTEPTKVVDPTEPPLVVVDPTPPPDSECPMLMQNTGLSKCPSDESVVTLKGAIGYDGLDYTNGEGVIYDIDFGSNTVTFSVNNVFATSSDIYVKHEVFSDGVSGFKESTCDAVKAQAPCLESGSSVDNTYTAACREQGYAIVYLYFATNNQDVINFDGNDPIIPECCYPDEYDVSPVPGEGTVGLVELAYKIDCSCPPMSTTRHLRGTWTQKK